RKIFPDGHPYTSGDCGKLTAAWQTLSMLQKIQLANEGDKCRAKKGLKRPLEKKQLKKYHNDGEIQTYPYLIDKNAKDYKAVLDSADQFAKKGDKTTILPKIKHKTDPHYDIIFGELKGTSYYGKCPDI